VDWSISSLVTIKPEFSNCGADEASVARFPDGRIAMTMRVRVDPNDGTTLPSGKFITTSRDLGRTWEEPQPLRYTDGTQVYCPASLAHIFVSSKNGRIYLITNFLDRPTQGCDPRTSLQIAELDPTTLRVIRDSLTTIETRQPDQLETIRFSNWRWYEDRETRDIVLFMTGCPGNQGRHEACRVPPHSYRYDLILPD
jgi:hypothetical protein